MKHQVRLLSRLIVAATILFTSCYADEGVMGPDSHEKLKINLSGEISQIYQTRVNDEGFCNGDEVGIYVVDYNGEQPGELRVSGNRGDNVKHIFDEASHKWNGAYDIYFKDRKTHIDLYGYYPYASPDNITEYAFQVQKDRQRRNGQSYCSQYLYR